MKYLLFTLSMPNCGSWNGRWSAEGNLHCRTKGYLKATEHKMNMALTKTSYYYNFGDGWGASVSVSKIDGVEKRKYDRSSKGFRGYDWMISEIEELGRIKTVSERREENGSKKN